MPLTIAIGTRVTRKVGTYGDPTIARNTIDFRGIGNTRPLVHGEHGQVVKLEPDGDVVVQWDTGGFSTYWYKRLDECLEFHVVVCEND